MIKSDSWFKSADKKKKGQSMENLHLFFSFHRNLTKVGPGELFLPRQNRGKQDEIMLKIG